MRVVCTVVVVFLAFWCVSGGSSFGFGIGRPPGTGQPGAAPGDVVQCVGGSCDLAPRSVMGVLEASASGDVRVERGRLFGRLFGAREAGLKPRVGLLRSRLRFGPR